VIRRKVHLGKVTCLKDGLREFRLVGRIADWCDVVSSEKKMVPEVKSHGNPMVLPWDEAAISLLVTEVPSFHHLSINGGGQHSQRIAAAVY
jgi:hypothetical protein